MTPSQIGVVLRDSHGIAQVKRKQRETSDSKIGSDLVYVVVVIASLFLACVYASPQVRSVTSNKVLRILKGSGLAPEIPEDLYYMIKKAVTMRKHLERNRADRDAKFRLILIESRIHRLARYYKTNKKLPPTWK